MTFKNGQWTFNDVSDGVWGIGEYFDFKEQAIEILFTRRSKRILCWSNLRN